MKTYWNIYNLHLIFPLLCLWIPLTAYSIACTESCHTHGDSAVTVITNNLQLLEMVACNRPFTRLHFLLYRSLSSAWSSSTHSLRPFTVLHYIYKMILRFFLQMLSSFLHFFFSVFSLFLFPVPSPYTSLLFLFLFPVSSHTSLLFPGFCFFSINISPFPSLTHLSNTYFFFYTSLSFLQVVSPALLYIFTSTARADA